MTIKRLKVASAFRPFYRNIRYKGARGGRGSGKSHFFASRMVERCCERPTRAVCIREYQNSIADSSKQLIEDKIQAHGVGWMFKITDQAIIGIAGSAMGSKIIFRGMQNFNAAKIKSLEGFDIAWVEEAQTLSKRSLNLLTPTIRKDATSMIGDNGGPPLDDDDPGLESEIWFSWNPEDPTDPVDEFFMVEGKDDPDFCSILVNHDSNPWFPDVLRREMQRDKKRDYDKYLHVWEGEYRSASQARVFNNWKVKPFETPANAIFYHGGDWGFTNDPSVLVRMFIIGRTIFIDMECHGYGVSIDNRPFLFAGCEDPRVNALNGAAYNNLTPQQKAEWKGIPTATSHVIRADSSSPETIDYMNRHGFPRMVQATKGPGSVDEGVKFLQSYDVVIHPRCKFTHREFKNYSFVVDKRTEEVTNVLQDKDNHVIDSVRYAVENVRKMSRVAVQELPV